MKTACLIVANILLLTLVTFAQKTDSLFQVQWEASLKKLNAGDLNDATLGFTQLINSGFSNKEVFVKRGVAYYQLKEYDKAKNDLDEALKARINTSELFEYRGNTKYNLNDYQGAATDLEKAIGLGAKSYETFANLGNAKFRMENYKDAIVNYDKAVAAGKADAILYNNRAIENLTNFIDNDFESCVREIYSAKGRVVITGIGKSAIIANKIVATLNSTGTPALFMHAADAIHGDLGMIQNDDIVMCISKSGNTPEIKVLVPLLKRRGSKLVALVSNTNSYLAQQADFVLNATIAKEACPHNLAPTTSTAVHMAMGDALAVCLLELRDFSSTDFAEYHPGGSLGKQLYLKVSDIYTHNELPMVRPDTPIKDVILEISSKRLGCTSVVDENKNLLGIITDGDLRRMLQKNLQLETQKASDIMTRNPKTIEKDAFAVKALHVMQENNITQLAVVDEKKIAGFVHLHDLLKEGIV